MKKNTFYQNGTHQWHVLYDQYERRVVDTNVYVLTINGESMLMDPGGYEIFPDVSHALISVAAPSSIKAVFISHQDPDVISSLPLWFAINPNITWYASKLWIGFIRHYGGIDANIVEIPDEGRDITLGGTALKAVPAHYLHSAGNFHLYDPTARVMFSGDVGAALLPAGHSSFVDRRDTQSDDDAFKEHIANANFFHQRWMPSNKAKNDWCTRVRKLDIYFLCPQHGAIYSGKNVGRFIDWFDNLNVGTGIDTTESQVTTLHHINKLVI